MFSTPSAALALVAMAAFAGGVLAAVPPRCGAAAGGPKNAILMIADGVGFNAWTGAAYHAHGATRGYRYQQAFAAPVESVMVGVATQALHRVPSSDERGGFVPVDAGYEPGRRWAQGLFEVTGPQTTDSAAASTAMHSGVKTLRRHVGLDAEGRPVPSLHRLAKAAAMNAGVVTSVQIAHATPAAAWAQVRDRDGYAAIFEQMSEGGLDVLIGGGHPEYDDAGVRIDSPSDEAFVYVGGRALYERLTRPEGLNGFALIERRVDLEQVASGELAPSKLLGLLPVRRTLQQARPVGAPKAGHLPDLSLLSVAALEALSADGSGFMLTIEGGATDWANHANDLPRFLEEMQEFEQAVDAVVAWIEAESCWGDTLLVVTADHETGGLWPAASWHDRNGDGRYTSDKDFFVAHNPPAPTARDAMPDLRYGTDLHTSDLVPLWAIGAGARRILDGARTDPVAAAIWGPAWAWDGRYVDNTRVFDVISVALGLRDASPASTAQ